MPNGFSVQAQSPAAAVADLGFWMQSQIVGQPVAMQEAALSVLVEQIAANRFTLPRSRTHAARITEKGTAIVEVHGILINRYPIMGAFWGLTAYEGLGEQFRRLKSDGNVKRIVLDINSPGGLVAGIQTCADELEALAEEKPVYSIAHDMACSAGYWLGCMGEEFSVSPDGDVGSIGVRAGHVSYARYLEREGIDITTFKAGAAKADYAISEHLSEGAAAEMQFQIERQYDRFVGHVARYRSLDENKVRATDARCWVGQEAVAAGLADRVETLEELVERVEKNATRVKPKRKPKLDRGSKGGIAPASRNPAPPAPDDAAPSAGYKNGAKLMSHAEAAEDGTLAALITAAVKGVAAASPAAAVAPAAAASAPDKSEAEIASAERTRIFAILESEAAADKPKLAMALAKAGMAVENATGILAAAAAEAVAKKPSEQAELAAGLDAAMARRGSSAAIAPADASAGDKRPSLADRVASRYPANAKKGA